MDPIRYQWRGSFTNGELNALHAEAFDHLPDGHDWTAQVHAHSLGWMCGRDGERLVGFVNVCWDGDLHAFLIDVMVAVDHRRHGVGVALVREAARGASAAGCLWLHVDFEEEHAPFYLDACGFTMAPAGLMKL